MSETSGNGRRIVEDVTCLGCGCLCDDIGVVVEGDGIVGTTRACRKGVAWFQLGEGLTDEGPILYGEPGSLDTAIDHAARILAQAHAPLIWGLSRSTIEAQRVALAIADRLGAIASVAGGGEASRPAFQRVGKVSATWGEIKDRADVIVYDLFFPEDELPRLRERYADDAIGRFIPEGRSGRTIIHQGRSRANRAGVSLDHGDLDVSLTPEKSISFYWSLRCVVNGVPLDPLVVERLTGVSLLTLSDLADRLKRAKYGAFLVTDGTRTAIELEAILSLVRDLNAFTRFVAIDVPAQGGNEAGADSVLSWGSGFAGEVDFSRGYPRAIPGDGAIERLGRGEVDAALLIGDGLTASLDLKWLEHQPEAAAHMRRIPRIVVRPGEPKGLEAEGSGVSSSIHSMLHEADVILPTARPGIDDAGTVSRADGVMLPLRPPFPGRRVSQAEVLRRIETGLKELGR